MSRPKDISREILDYLRNHPDASDTLEGITEWWLMSQRINYEMKRVEAAVIKLVKQGWIIELNNKGSGIRYRLNPIKREELILRELPLRGDDPHHH